MLQKIGESFVLYCPCHTGTFDAHAMHNGIKQGHINFTFQKLRRGGLVKLYFSVQLYLPKPKIEDV